MKWHKDDVARGLSADFLRKDPAIRGHHRTVLLCAAQAENGGVFEGASEWSDREWLMFARISRRQALAMVAARLAHWKAQPGTPSRRARAFVVHFYDVDGEMRLQEDRRNGAKGAEAREKRRKKEGPPPSTPPSSPPSGGANGHGKSPAESLAESPPSSQDVRGRSGEDPEHPKAPSRGQAAPRAGTGPEVPRIYERHAQRNAFDRVVEAYPGFVRYRAAYAIWKRRQLATPDADRILTSLRWQKNLRSWTQDQPPPLTAYLEAGMDLYDPPISVAAPEEEGDKKPRSAAEILAGYRPPAKA